MRDAQQLYHDEKWHLLLAELFCNHQLETVYISQTQWIRQCLRCKCYIKSNTLTACHGDLSRQSEAEPEAERNRGGADES